MAYEYTQGWKTEPEVFTVVSGAKLDLVNAVAVNGAVTPKPVAFVDAQGKPVESAAALSAALEALTARVKKLEGAG